MGLKQNHAKEQKIKILCKPKLNFMHPATKAGSMALNSCKVKLKDRYLSTFGKANSPPCNLMLKHANSSHHAKPPSKNPCQQHPRLKHIFTLVSTRLTKRSVSRANKNGV